MTDENLELQRDMMEKEFEREKKNYEMRGREIKHNSRIAFLKLFAGIIIGLLSLTTDETTRQVGYFIIANLWCLSAVNTKI